MNQFDFDAVGIPTEHDEPLRLAPDSYEVLRQQVNALIADTGREGQLMSAEEAYTFYDANQFNLATNLDYAFHDLDGLNEASLVTGGWNDTPALAKAVKRCKVSGIPMIQFESHFAHRAAQAMQATQGLLSRAAITNLRGSANYMLASESEQARMERQAIPHIAAIQNANLSQQARGVQKTTWERVQPHFIKWVNRFNARALGLGWRYSLRMPIAMIPAMRDDLLQSSRLGGIAMPEAYHSATQNELITMLHDAGILDMVFAPIAYQDENLPIQNRANFMWWDSIASMASAINNNGVHVSLKPATLPPWLLLTHDRAASFFMGEYTLGTYTEVGVQHLILSPDDLDPDMGGYRDNESAYMAHGLSLLALGVSLWATQIRMGTGHRVPSWTNSPLNPVLVQWFVEELARMNQL